MFFDRTLFNNILKFIEGKLSFSEDNITNVYGWNLQLKLNIQELFDEFPSGNDDIKYILKVLDLMDCIKFEVNNPSTIDNLTPKGLKFLFSYLHNIDFS